VAKWFSTVLNASSQSSTDLHWQPQEPTDDRPWASLNSNVIEVRNPQSLPFSYCCPSGELRSLLSKQRLRSSKAPQVEEVKLPWEAGGDSERPLVKSVFCLGCWPSLQPGIYAELSGRLFSANAQVQKQL
jgi:hypothetical protein